MQLFDTIQSLKNCVHQWRKEGLSIGFVPTMGNLHAGHINLVNAAAAKCDKVVVSIFINPLQFNETSDFNAYPKTLDEDQSKLEQAGVDCLFLPTSQMMYPAGQNATSKICVAEITNELEGECRPGHFDGVSTIVNKLFNMVQPNIAFFGEKDFQQLLLIKKMVKDLNMPLDIQAVATCREDDGLAMSSRNARLTAEHRKRAAELYQVLGNIKSELEKQPDDVQQPDDFQQLEVKALIVLKNLGFEPEYLSIRSADDLQIATSETKHKIVLVAARLGGVRLIDNLFL